MEIKDVIVRPAQPEDKTAVLNFCQHTWADAEDYIPQVWDQWLSEPSGQILVAVFAGQPVAMTRVVQLSEHEGCGKRYELIHNTDDEDWFGV